MLKPNSRILVMAILSMILPLASTAQTDYLLLKGQIETEKPVEVTVIYDSVGDTYVKSLKTSADGRFEYSGNMPDNGTDVLIYAGSDIYGAFLQNGKTAEIFIKGKNASFAGDNMAENEFFNAYEQAFNPMKYKPSGDQAFVLKEYKKNLDNSREDLISRLPRLKSGVRERGERMTKSYYDKTLCQLLGMDQSYNGNVHDSEIDSIVATVDPNADESRLSGIINYWYNKSDLHKNSNVVDITEYIAQQYAGIDSLLTNEGNKKNLWKTLGGMYYIYQPSDEDVAKFLNAVEPQLVKAPKVREYLAEVRDAYKPKIKDGDKLATDPIVISSDGKECRLSDLIGKNVVYIDIWATWCMPCCKEIPFMEKVASHYKGNDKISFLSLSRDENTEAWQRKLAKDKPEWAQYIFEKSSGDEFMNAMGINGIPRFLIVGKDGRLIAADAARPSDENIIEILDKAIDM